MRYRRDIDGLRAIAIVPVVVFHIFPSIMPGGFIGVDIFFVVSGYLISGVIIDALIAGKFNFVEFYSRRIRRIFPALIVVMTCCLAFGWFALLPDEFEHLGKYILGGSAFANNIVLWSESGYFDQATRLKPMVHLWSLGIEEQFYVLYPFIFWLAWRVGFNLLAVVVVLLVTSFLLNIAFVESAPVATFNLLPTRIWELAAGGVLACIHARHPDRRMLPTGSEHVAAPFGLALILVSVFVIDKDKSYPGWWAVAPVLGTYVLIAAGPRSWVNAKILANRHAVFVGLISYPLYLWHWPLIAFGQVIEAQFPSLQIRTIILALSFALAYSTFEMLEKPIRFGRLAGVSQVIPVLCGLSVAVGLAGVFAFGGILSPHTRDVFDDNLAQFIWPTPAVIATENCRKFVGHRTLVHCSRSAPVPPQVAVIGDSHSDALYPGLAKAYQKLGKTVINVGSPGCVPFFDMSATMKGHDFSHCTDDMNFVLDFVATSRSIETIIVVTRGPRNMYGTDFGEFESVPHKQIRWLGAPESWRQPEMFFGAYRNTLARLTRSGKEIVLISNWPDIGFDPKSCIDVRPVRLINRVRTPCAAPRSAIDARYKEYREFIQSLQGEFPGVKVFDTFPHLCDSSWCYAMKEGRLLYKDGHHVGMLGSKYLGERFVAEVQSRLR